MLLLSTYDRLSVKMIITSRYENIKSFYKNMLFFRRRFEERVGQLYGLGLIGGFCHLYIGQEAVSVGMEAAIEGRMMLLLLAIGVMPICYHVEPLLIKYYVSCWVKKMVYPWVKVVQCTCLIQVKIFGEVMAL